MSVFLEPDARILVQGITGNSGQTHARLMHEYGSLVVGGTSPGKGGTEIEDLPVFNSVQEALSGLSATQRPTWTIGFVPAPHAKAAALEAIAAGLNTVIITEHIPVYDTMEILAAARAQQVHAIGPNCPGIIVPGSTKIGIMPGNAFAPGRVGMVSRSGTLTYEIVTHLTAAGIGQSTCVGIGGDPINLTSLAEVLLAFEADPQTDAIVLIGEIGGVEEERAAKELIGTKIRKPIVAYLAGRTAPPGKVLGHAGALIEGGQGSVASKERALLAAGVRVAVRPSQVARLIKEVLPR